MLVDDETFQFSLAVGAFQHTSLTSAASGESEDQHWSSLPNAVDAILGL